MQAGYIVLADRYVFTAYARDIVRGRSEQWIRKVYNFAIKPDVTFYFRVPTDIAADRILSGRPKLKYYEAGMDLNLSNDLYESYRIFQSRIIDEYESMITPEGFTVIDGTTGIEEQQTAVREKTMQLLPKQQQQVLRGSVVPECIPIN
jgi:dTMP kinase